MKVLNFGSLNIDFVYSVNHIIMSGETLAAADMHTFLGGKGLNQSIALARAGVPVYHAGMIGSDGDALRAVCRENGVNTDFIHQIPGNSGHTIIQVDPDGQNAILLFGGANHNITKEFVDMVFEHFGSDDILLLQNEVNLLAYIIEKAFARKMKIILNPSPYHKALKACDLSKISLFLLNEIEGFQMTGERDTEQILRQLRLLYPQAKVVLTIGRNGSVYQDEKRQYRQGIYRVQAVDSTAAGDTFTGYFIAGMLEKLSIPESLKMAAKASALTVSKAGAVNSIPKKTEVLSFFGD